jgi:NAD-dependent dihydropyrimidine dehydrogenase PreA subunit
MIAAAAPTQRILLYEGDGSQPFEPQERFALLKLLLEHGYTAGRVVAGASLPDLGHRELVVLGRFGGSILERLSTQVSEVKLHVRDVTGCAPEQILELVRELCKETGGSTAAGWKPWFPVIDFDRCTNCMQCLSFCLFDVYGVTTDGKITVQNENNCKTDCPACSRVCPEVAILFPKYKAGPINGDEVSSEDVRREAMKVDISALLGGDIYSLLRDRSAKAKSRFSKERDDERALKERQRCLTKLKEGADLDIPAEVLSSLPSLDQIQQKAREAKQRAQAAIERNQANALRSD